jgi:hypothetical protein
VAVSTSCKLISAGAVIKGTMSITKAELYFEMDEDDEENKGVDAKVGALIISSTTAFLQSDALPLTFLL